ncbi:hypothetical protein ACFFRR_010198 [Megaselia abdita]
MNAFLVVLVSAVAVSAVYAAPSACPEMCPLNWAPLCAENNGCSKTFSNGCELSVAVCNGLKFTFKYDGECQGTEKACEIIESRANQCGEACTKEYEPICGSDSNGVERTFSNACVMKTQNCEEGSDFVHKYDGICLKDSQTQQIKSRGNQCGEACTKEYEPICGSDSNGVEQTFSNACVMKTQNCEEGSGEWFLFFIHYENIYFILFFYRFCS